MEKFVLHVEKSGVWRNTHANWRDFTQAYYVDVRYFILSNGQDMYVKEERCLILLSHPS